MKEFLKSYSGWAIDLNTKEGHGLIGRYFWTAQTSRNIPPHMEGHVTALYKTRREAREVLRAMKEQAAKHNFSAWSTARVRKVNVIIWSAEDK